MSCLQAGRCPPVYPICCCTPVPPPAACCGPRFTRESRLRIDRCKVAGVRVELAACDVTEASMWIRRRGQDAWLLQYPAMAVDASGALVFRFDDLLLELAPGRYEAQIRVGCDPCGCLEVEVPPGCAGVRAHTPLMYHTEVDPEGPEDADMFEPLVSFSAELCRPLAPGDTALPLLPADAARLCAVTLCRPVQLVLDDGVQRETVEFSGCTAGVPTVRRGVAGTVALSFPKGSTLKFVWTEANVLAASEGCP
jgi:hypothetical protein